jgi:methylase of polypeptide subunit release factors
VGNAASSEPEIVAFVSVPQLTQDIALLDSVFWEPDDTRSLRELISKETSLRDATVLEIGTGSGLVSLCCLQAGAREVVATDINPKAVENARMNGKELGFREKLDVRLVPRRAPSAWTVIRPEERFDFIISNPPWEDAKPKVVAEFALYDPDFELLDSLLYGARLHLKPKGRMWLAYGCVTAIRRIQHQATQNKLSCQILDERSLDSLPEVFLPGMLIEVTVPPDSP